MDDKDYKGKIVNKRLMGNFTKKAIETFEENIVSQKDYLEKVKK